MYCVTKSHIILVLALRFCLYTLYKHSLIAYYETTTFPCINLIHISLTHCIYKLVLLLLLVVVVVVVAAVVVVGYAVAQ
jgi:hypothetical protein